MELVFLVQHDSILGIRTPGLEFFRVLDLMQLPVISSVTGGFFVCFITFYEVALGSQNDCKSIDPLVHILNQ